MIILHSVVVSVLWVQKLSGLSQVLDVSSRGEVDSVRCKMDTEQNEFAESYLAEFQGD